MGQDEAKNNLNAGGKVNTCRDLCDMPVADRPAPTTDIPIARVQAKLDKASRKNRKKKSEIKA